jgi:hypothetical protein
MFRTNKAHYYTLKICGFDGEIKTVRIRYIHFVNEKTINHTKLLRTNKSKPSSLPFSFKDLTLISAFKRRGWNNALESSTSDREIKEERFV